MLTDLYLDAIKNKENKLSGLRDESLLDILKIASNSWINYSPKRIEAHTIGIDSSWNKKSYQGIDLFVIDCVAVTSFNLILSSRWNYGIKIVNGDSLSSEAMAMEIDLSNFIISMDEKFDILCIDGSVISNTIRNKSAHYTNILHKLIKNNSNSLILFISKNSNTKNQFKKYGAKAADIYYFNKIGYKSGFSLPNINTNSSLSNTFDVMEIYARITPFVPLIKIEIINNLLLSNDEIRSMMDRLYYHSVKGYPYCLKLAHKCCKITNEDIKRIASIYELKNEFGSRDSLNE